MGEDLITRIKKQVCRFIGHSKGETWEHNGCEHSVCKRCNIIYTSSGFYKERSFKSAAESCGIGESIYRRGNVYKKYARNHNVPLRKRISFLDRMSRDWVIYTVTER